MWGKPIDVASQWIEFVDDSVLASELSASVPSAGLGVRLYMLTS